LGGTHGAYRDVRCARRNVRVSLNGPLQPVPPSVWVDPDGAAGVAGGVNVPRRDRRGGDPIGPGTVVGVAGGRERAGGRQHREFRLRAAVPAGNAWRRRAAIGGTTTGY